MTETVSVPVVVPSPATMAAKTAGKSNGKSAVPPPRNSGDLDRFMNEAKRLVVDNYNRYHDPSKNPNITMKQVYIISFSWNQDNWSATLGSTENPGFMYNVAYLAYRKKAYLGIYKKINSATIDYK